MMKKKQGVWRIKPDKASLPVQLTDDELIAKGEELAVFNEEKNRKEAEKRETAKSYKTIIDGLQARMDGLCQEIHTKTEIREVECEWRFGHPEDMQKALIRLDTGELVRIEAVEQWELQEELPCDPDEGGKER